MLKTAAAISLLIILFINYVFVDWLLEDSGIYEKIFKPKKGPNGEAVFTRKPTYIEYIILIVVLDVIASSLPEVVLIVICACELGFLIGKKFSKKG